jgi:inosose dehydratase
MTIVSIDRRSFIAAAALATVSMKGVTADYAEGSPLSLGFSLYGMKMVPLEKALRICAEIGYQHVELSLNPGYETEPSLFSGEARSKTAKLLNELKLDVPALMVLMSLVADDQTHTAALKLIAEGSRVATDIIPARPPVLETVLGGSPGKWDEQKGIMVERLGDWAEAAEKENAILLIKAHIGSAVNSPERLLWLLDQVPSLAIQVAYDYSHFELQGIDMEESMKQLLPRTRFIHVKDSQGDAKKFQFVLPGQGRTDYVKYFQLLRKYQYSGPVCVEVSGQVFNQPGYDPILAAKSCFASLSAAMRESGTK